LNWLATSGSPALELDDLPSKSDAHTNIVAGFVSEDGRTVVARLPRAEAELESFPAPQPPPGLFAATTATVEPEEPEFTLVTTDGRSVAARFVGLDASTGLSLLEAEQPVLPAAPLMMEGDTEDPTVGQRVHLFAPAQVPPSAAQAGVGYVYLSIDQKEGLLTEVRRAPSGKPFRVVARASNLTPAWTGAIAANELGEVVGIVSQSDSGETQIVPVATIISARERVMKLRGSAPQPWLGVRGDATFQSPLDVWVSTGWKPESALPHIKNGQGVLLTAVAPGTPAALAGFRPGDVIAQVGSRDVRSVEDLSFTLNEAGVGSTVDFTVWRALEPAPVKLSVQLRGTQNAALDTAKAEETAARESLLVLQKQVRAVRDEEGRLKAGASSTDAAALARISERLRDIEERMEEIRTRMDEAEARMYEAGTRVFAARDYAPVATTAAQAESLSRAATVSARLEACGLNAIGLTQRSAAHLGARGGLLVVAVRPESLAASAGLRAGDVIETVNGSTYNRIELRRTLYGSDANPVSLGVVREGQRLTLQLATSFEKEK
jgi:S1-C subfamily serine protease